MSIRISVDTSVAPMSGWIEAEAAPRWPFTGWLELVARLADAVSAQPQHSEPAEASTPSTLARRHAR